MTRWCIGSIVFLLLLSACNGTEKSKDNTKVGQDFPTITPQIRLTRVVPTHTPSEPETTITANTPSRTPMRLLTSTPDDDAPRLPTAGPSLTPTKVAPSKTPTPVPPGIRTFTVSPNPVSENSMVVFNWEIQGATGGAIRWTRPWTGTSETALTVNKAVGSAELYLDNSIFVSQQITFELVVDFSDGQRRSEAATLTINCLYSYFVIDPPGQDTSCPLNAFTDTQAAYQPFEKGFMLWTDYTQLIYVLYNNSQCEAFTDNWTGEDVTFEELPPKGLYQPIRGFGYLWVNRQGVRNRLGWATEQELGYTALYQQANMRDDYDLIGPAYVRLPYNSTVRINTAYGGCSWGLVN